MSRTGNPVTNVVTAAGWMGLVAYLLWQEFFAEVDRLDGGKPTPWWFRVPLTLVLGLIVLVFAIECLSQEMTVRRWATSVVVFAAVGVLFVLAGVFDPLKLHLARWVSLPAGAFYLAAAALAGSAARDVFD